MEEKEPPGGTEEGSGAVGWEDFGAGGGTLGLPSWSSGCLG